MKIKDLRKMGKEELEKRLREIKLELFKQRGLIKTRRPVKNPGVIRKLRKDIARILTILKEKR